jgi:hypothetical protein
MTKLPYDVLAIQIEKLFEKEMPDNDEEIDQHCQLIDAFIEAAGWNVEEYFERWMQEPGN